MMDATLPLAKDDKIDIEENWFTFKSMLDHTGRKGVKELLNWLETTDARIAPASHKFHLSVPGGLIQHSLNTWSAMYNIDKSLAAGFEYHSMVLVSLLHDLCKVDMYVIKEEWDKEYKDKTNQWRKKEVYGIADSFPYGHGEKSVTVALEQGLGLSREEMLAIRYHMGFSDPSSQTMSFKEAWAKCALAKMLAMADQTATVQEDHLWTKEENKS